MVEGGVKTPHRLPGSCRSGAWVRRWIPARSRRERHHHWCIGKCRRGRDQPHTPSGSGSLSCDAGDRLRPEAHPLHIPLCCKPSRYLGVSGRCGATDIHVGVRELQPLKRLHSPLIAGRTECFGRCQAYILIWILKRPDQSIHVTRPSHEIDILLVHQKSPLPAGGA